MSGVAQCILSMAVGGGEQLVRTLSQRLRIPGYRNHVLCFDRIEAFREEFADAGVGLTLIRRRQRFFDAEVLRPMVRFVRERRIRLLHAHDLSALTYALAAGRLCGARVVMTEHSRHYIDEALKRRVEKWVLAMLADRWVQVSPELRAASIGKDRVPASKIEVIENGVDIARFRDARPAPIRRDLGIPDATPLLLSVGRLETIKGHRHLIRALAHPRLAETEIGAVLAGDGADRPTLERMAAEAGIADRIHFLGARTDIPELMAACEIFVLPSESEGLPFALLEAMASGLPVVATAVGKIPALLQNGRHGAVAPPRNPEALAGAIAETIRDFPASRERARRARDFVAARYGQTRMLERYGRLYRNMLARGRST
jgi:glycosyltransferase involved in cell wall biosynthesis